MSMLAGVAGGAGGGGGQGVKATSSANTSTAFGDYTYVMPTPASVAVSVPAATGNNTTLMIGGAIVALLLAIIALRN